MNTLRNQDFIKAITDPSSSVSLISAGRRIQPENWCGSLDTLNSHLICFVETGAIRGIADDTPLHLEAGDALWCPPGITRQIWNAPNLKSVTSLRLRFSVKNQTLPLDYPASPMIKTDAWKLTPYLRLLIETWQTQAANWQQEARALITGLFIRFASCSDKNKKNKRILTQPQRDQLMALIYNEAASNITPAKLAKSIGYNADYFSRIFKNTYDMSAKTFIKETRLRQAAEMLLDENLTIKEICHIIDENNQSKFHRQFKTLFGITPAAYRSKH